MQISPLVKAGFRVIAPDLRGGLGGESDAPKEVEGYDIPKSIVEDVAGTLVRKCHTGQPGWHISTWLLAHHLIPYASSMTRVQVTLLHASISYRHRWWTDLQASMQLTSSTYTTYPPHRGHTSLFSANYDLRQALTNGSVIGTLYCLQTSKKVWFEHQHKNLKSKHQHYASSTSGCRHHGCAAHQEGAHCGA